MNWLETELNIFVVLLCTYPVQFGLVFIAGMLSTVAIKRVRNAS